MPTHRKPASRRTPIYTAMVVAFAVFVVIIGFGGRSKNASPTAAVSSRPTSPHASATSISTLPPTTKPSPVAKLTSKPAPRPKPSPTSTGLGTTDATLGALSQQVKTQPVRIKIPALGVNAQVIPAGVDSTGALAVPDNVFQAVWFQAGSAPGQPGTAIIAAHVDFGGALGLFNGLHTLRKGAVVYVTDLSGKARRFVVTSGQLVPKNDPSTVEALATASATPGRPSLALITCGGDLNYAKHRYYDNYVLLADL